MYGGAARPCQVPAVGLEPTTLALAATLPAFTAAPKTASRPVQRPSSQGFWLDKQGFGTS